MKNVDDLIASAAELAGRGLSKGEIADELNVSRETASWLVDRADTTEATEVQTGTEPTPTSDIHVDWSAIGRDSSRLTYAAKAMADLMAAENGGVEDGAAGDDGGDDGDVVDLTVGIEKAGVPLATAIGRALDTDIATYAPAKHQWEEGAIAERGGGFSRNFAGIRDRQCYVVDDIVTSGTTMQETVEAIRAEGGDPVACCVLADKGGAEEIDGVPVYSLIDVVRVERGD
ncbi:transcriptional regulator GfcR [Haloparvum sp. PAK95]|uniref:transcriptional regulator GfcR n=1 Tax=Haloparvum sp. PAK95 TaxID=3418962 RepID=UPI003D2E9FD8